MKLVQLVRPLFLTALGLHVLVLFVPIGASETVVVEDVEDVEISELAEEPEAVLPSGPLPVPDPNVAVSTAAPTTARANPAAVRSPTARPGTSSPSPARTAPTAQQRAAAARADNSATAPATPAASTEAGSQSQTNPQTDESTSATGSTATSGNESFLSSLATEAPDPGAESENSNSDERSSESSRTPEVLTLGMLRDKVTQEIPPSLIALANQFDKALTYSDKNTDDNSAQAARDAWKADIQRQASVGVIQQIEPAEIAELAQVAYPIESSVKQNGHSFRICLSREPGNAEVGMLFDAQGQIVGEPALLRSTGYSAINEEILATVATYAALPLTEDSSPLANRASKAYVFDIEVAYDAEACVSLRELKGDA